MAMELPLFPLHTVLFPGIALPLHVFEERYRKMIARCLAEGTPFGTVLIRNGREVGGGRTTIATVGTVAEIREATRLAGGRYDLLAVGSGRFRIESVTVGSQPYLVGSVEPLADVVGDPDRTRRLARRATRRFVRYLMLVRPGDDEEADEIDVQVELEVDDDAPEPAGPIDRTGEPIEDPRITIPDDPTILSFLLSGIVQVDQPRRQDLLEADTTEARLEALLRVLDREIFLLERRLRSYSVDLRLAAVRRN